MTIFFTIVANNYIAYAETLMESVALHHPASRRFIILCDEFSPGVTRSSFADIVLARDLGQPDFVKMAFHYDVMELATSIKPPTFLWLLRQYPDAKVIYLDPDIMVTAPLDHVLDALDSGSSVVLTPHITAPLQDGCKPDDLTIMKSGIYNLGFAAFRATPESLAFLEWWRDRCERDAIVDIAENKFTDQRWVDMAPAFVPTTHILHHHSYNLAYWNLPHRTVTVSGQQTLVDGEPLRFVHFSGLNPADRSRFSKHQNRFNATQIGALRPLYDRYVERLLAHGWFESSRMPYAYDRFESGRKVHTMMRLSFRRHRDDMTGDPARGSGAIFDQGEPSLAALGPPSITRVLYELWERRADLGRHFDVKTAAGRENYLKWVGASKPADTGLDQDSIAAAKAMLPGTPKPPKQMRPWPSQRSAVFKGARGTVDEWLGRPVPLNIITDSGGIPIPRQLALLWEGREDVSRHFPCQTTANMADFLMWCITDGVSEQGVDLDIAGPALVSYFGAVESEGNEAMPPMTRLMRLCMTRYDGPFAYLVHEAPIKGPGRIALALWLIGPATRDHGWPPSFTARLREWFARHASPIAEAGSPFSNLAHSLWLLRADVRETFDIATVEGQLRLLSWMLNDGLREMRLGREVLSSELREVLNAKLSPGAPGFSRFHAMMCSIRTDLQQHYSIGTPAQQEALMGHLAAEKDDEWSAGNMMEWLADPHLTGTAEAAATCAPAVNPQGGILLTGLVTTASGRGEDVRMSEASLRAVGVPSIYLDRNSGQYVRDEREPKAAALSAFAVNIVHLNAETALEDHLFLRRNGAASAYTIGYWAWELSAFPADWAYAFACFDEIWASTRFAYEAIAKASSRPVTLMPMAVEMPSVDSALSRADFDLPDDRFVFYFGFDFRSFVTRKNPEATIAAFRMAFPAGTEKVALLIKTLGGETKPKDLAALRALVKADPRIIVQDREYNSIERATLVSLCDCYVSLHRSEGFGRGPAEAMLLGRPVIATNYSGNTDFMNERNSLPVNYKLIPLVAGDYPGWERQEWADPDPAHAAEHMKFVVADPAAARRLGKAAARDILKYHGTVPTGTRMKARLDSVLQSLPGHEREVPDVVHEPALDQSSMDEPGVSLRNGAMRRQPASNLYS